MTDKAALRTSMRKRRNGLSAWEVDLLSQAAQQHILDDDAWLQAASVGIYISVRNEVQTGLLAQAAWKAGKTVLVPYIPEPADGAMYLLTCPDDTALVPNRFGIPEPTPATCPLKDLEEEAPDVLIVPGIVFDMKGQRIGSGGGYYDRLLAKPHMRTTVRIGLAYAFQVSETPIPADRWDIPLNAIATEEGLVWL